METNKDISKKLKQTYSLWKKDSLTESGFFPLFNGFLSEKKLKSITGGALKLYIYLGLYSDNKSGEVWHSNKKISQYFNKNERTIRLWMQELESLNLIRRMQLEYDGEPHIFLQPYASTTNLQITNKFVYTYRLKNVEYREILNLTSYSKQISDSLEKKLSNVHINVKDKIFTITSYHALKQNELKKVNSILLKDIPQLDQASSSYSYQNKSGKTIKSKILFERIRTK